MISASHLVQLESMDSGAHGLSAAWYDAASGTATTSPVQLAPNRPTSVTITVP